MPLKMPILTNGKKYVTYILLGILLFSLSIRIVSFFIPHIENDEVIYRTLAQKVSKNLSDYSLQGTQILKQLPKSQYDYPIFRHPPLFIYLLALVYGILGIKFGILIPILSGVGIILMGFLISKRLFSTKEGVVTSIILCFCPILLFTSTKLWIDTSYVFLMALSFYIFIIAYEKKNHLTTIFAGIIFGLAMLTKYASLGMAPVILIYAFLKRNSFKNFFMTISIFSIASFIVILPWLYFYHAKMGSLLYSTHFKITPQYADMFPFVKLTLQRPDYFYFKELLIVTPVYIFSIFSLFIKEKRKENIILLIWVLGFIIGLIVFFKLNLIGYVLRYLLPVTIPLAILSSQAILRWKKFTVPLGVIFVFYQLITGLLSTYIFYSADIFSIFFYLKRLLYIS